jgi:hypothetical protein
MTWARFRRPLALRQKSNSGKKKTQQVAIRNAVINCGEKRSLDGHDGNPTREEKQEHHSQKFPFEQMISYNIDEGERPDGIRVRFKVRIVTGKHAAALDARQAEAIREILLWTRDNPPRQEPPSR